MEEMGLVAFLKGFVTIVAAVTFMAVFMGLASSVWLVVVSCYVIITFYALRKAGR